MNKDQFDEFVLSMELKGWTFDRMVKAITMMEKQYERIAKHRACLTTARQAVCRYPESK